jgi:CRP-like cAMP-binding protein
MAKRQAYLQHLAAVPMFHACSKKELDLIARHAEEFRFPAGEKIVVEGEIGLEFYVIMEGTAKVTRHGVQLATLGPGDFFGELALLDHARRNATVEALTPLVAVVLARREFDGLMAEAPAVTHKLLVGMARRLHELDAHV